MEAIPPGTTMVIVPDASSNEYEIHQALSERGIKVVVLDHHEAPRYSEYACVVNNQLCDYPTKSLSGVGVVYKVCQYIDSILPPEQRCADDYLDLVAVGMTADMMSIRDMETHFLIQEGLQRFRNPFIKGMAEKNHYQLGDNPAPIDVAFYIVPLVNAVTRVGTMEEKTLLFESMLEWKAYDLIPSTKRGCKGQQETRLEQSLRTCTNVKNRQTRDQDKAVNQVREIIEEQNLLEHKVLIVKVKDPDYDRSITGLIANKLMAEYRHPVCLVSPTVHNGKPAWAGSMRCPSTPELPNFREFCENSGLVYLCQG